MSRITSLVTASAVALALCSSASAEQERFTAFAVNMSNIGTGSSANVDIVIDRWSSEAERDRLIKVFNEKGQDGLLKELQKIKPAVGRINIVGQLGWDLQYAREQKGEDGGRRIFIATDRKINFQEAANRPRSMDYPFTLIELHIDKDGEGEGRASVATKIYWNKKENHLELENYSSQPVMLNKVRKQN